MTQPLFIEPEQFVEKLAVEMRLPEDPNRWPMEILQELFKQVPYIADFEPHVEMDRADGEKGYGFGHIEISNQTEAPAGSSPDQLQAAGIRGVRVPVVIREGMLQPLDLIVTSESKVLPLTEPRLRQAIFRPQAFDVTARTPGDQSMIGQLYPPYRQNYGMGGGGIAMSTGIGKQSSAKSQLEQYLEREHLNEKNAAAIDDYFSGHNIRHGRLGKQATTYELGDGEGRSAAFLSKTSSALKKTASLLSAILPTINVSDYETFIDTIAKPGIQAAFTKNAAATMPAMKALLEYDITANAPSKVASAFDSLIAPSVVQISRNPGVGYTVKAASHLYWDPVVQDISPREAIQRFGSKVVLAADLNGAVTIGQGADTKTEEPAPSKAGPVTKYGLYKVYDDQGNEHIGAVIPNLIDIDGVALPLALFTNGTVATVQTDICGECAGDAHDLPSSLQMGGRGFFFKHDGDKMLATIPLTCQSSTSMPGEPMDCQCETFDGRPIVVSQQPNIQTLMPIDGKLLVPMDWKWSSLDKTQAVDLAGGEDDIGKEAAVREYLGSVTIRSGGTTFDLDGPAISKLAEQDRRALDVNATLFTLVGLGVHPDHAIAKMGSALTGKASVLVKVGRILTPASAARAEAVEKAASAVIPNLRRNLVKEAAFMPDPTAVDTVLSLGFVNPENLSTFVAYLPEIDEAQQHLCEILLAARLGMNEVPVGALEKAIKSTEEVIEGLKVLAFTS